MIKRHAYLIMAHNQEKMLAYLLGALDYEFNDIYLHIDKKMQSYDKEFLRKQVSKGVLYILPNHIDVSWGSFSQIECELYLLKEATKTSHVYYHLMSGMDMPIKSQEYIHKFFEENNGTEYVQFDSINIDEKNKSRVSKYHFIVKRRDKKTVVEKVLDKALISFQFFVDRTRKTQIVYQKGPNWFSISHNLAKYICEHEEYIRKTFKYTICGDEMFVQTIVYNSNFRERVSNNNYSNNYENILYCIDWVRGNPYVYRDDDYSYLTQSKMLFARKFDLKIDERIVNKLLIQVREE